MATIMQRWATAKQRLTLAVPRVIEAIREAREIRARCLRAGDIIAAWERQEEAE